MERSGAILTRLSRRLASRGGGDERHRPNFDYADRRVPSLCESGVAGSLPVLSLVQRICPRGTAAARRGTRDRPDDLAAPSLPTLPPWRVRPGA
jgi:hypothetical protein